MFERGTGDVLIDEWNDDLGNVGAMKAPDMEKGYDWDSVSVDFRSGDSGHAAFRLSDGSETMYLSYAGIPYSDLELLVIAPGSVCMAAANNNKRGTYSMIIAIILEFGLFLTVILIEEKRRQRIMEGRRIQLEEALEKANAANAAKSRFLSKMSHDIRTPLNGIIGLIDISEANPDNLEMLEENRKKEKVAANHLLSLVNDVLNMSKLEEDKVELAHEAFDIRKLADDILTITQMRAEDAGVRLEHQDCKVNIPHPYVYGSPLHVRQIFVNILGNAIKYNKTGGSIITRIESGKCENGIIWYTCRIADTGIGMSSEFLEHLFDPFAQEKVDARSVYQGSGLGMSIAKSLIDKMGGTIEVKSEQGAGSEFVVTLPFEIATEESVRSEAFGDESASIDGVKILMAEDNELNREIAVELLREKGAVVTTVNDGQAAVDAVSKCGDDEYDVILMDVMMPKMDGFTVLSKIRSEGCDVPVIMLTAKAETDDKINGLDLGADDYLAKPFEMKELLARIRSITRRKSDAVSAELKVGDCTLNSLNYELTGPGGSVKLQNKEYQIMEMLMANQNSVISAELMMEKIWGYDSDAEINVVWVNISYLRKKLGQIKSNVSIKAVRNQGYVLEFSKA